jgi:Icc protein
VAERARSRTVLQLSDLHLLSEQGARLLGVDTAATFQAVLDAAFAAGPVDAVVVTGDIAHDGDPATYRRAGALLAERFQGPAMWLPGNHDLAAPLAAAFPDVREIDLDDWLVLGIDTHVDDEEAGFVDGSELDRIEAVLGASGARSVLAFGHHPCVEVGTPWLDGGRIANSSALLDVLEADPRLAGYGFGHIHHAREYRSTPWPLLSAPATCFAFAQGGTRFGVEVASPGCRRFVLAEGLTSAVVRANDCVVAPDRSRFRGS